jgi:hypothetical protein
MSIAALLKNFGIHVPRYVTMAGEVVFDGVSPGGGGYSHPTHGAVTQVAPHTFHDGVEPDDDVAGESVWWDDPAQIGRHLDAMQTAFPGFTYVPAEDGLGPCWVGTIDTGRGAFRVALMLRRDRGLPSVIVTGRRLGAQSGRRWTPSPHLYTSGSLCIADRADWHPEEHTVATATAWAAHWLAAYTEWRMSRRWPVDGVQSAA